MSPRIGIMGRTENSDELPSSSFAGNVAYVEALPGEVEAWLVGAVNRIRERGVGVGALSVDDVRRAMFDTSDSMSEALGYPLVDRASEISHGGLVAFYLTMLCRVFGLAFTPADTKES